MELHDVIATPGRKIALTIVLAVLVLLSVAFVARRAVHQLQHTHLAHSAQASGNGHVRPRAIPGIDPTRIRRTPARHLRVPQPSRPRYQAPYPTPERSLLTF